MKNPHLYRKGIPFFYDKSESEFSRDPYERFDDVIIRQTVLHLADGLWKDYPMQMVANFIKVHTQVPAGGRVVEVGCGLGRLIASIAMARPDIDCWGIDYSYQMLKRASEFWLEGKTIVVDATARGLEKIEIRGHLTANLKIGLARAEDLPFEDNSCDTVFSSFVLERLQDPVQGLLEMHRVLKSSGQMLLITPLNFTSADHWQQLYPPEKLRFHLEKVGFQILHIEENMPIPEPLDGHGNVVNWNCVGLVCLKHR